jgi:hypothetical protein
MGGNPWSKPNKEANIRKEDQILGIEENKIK